MRYRLSTAMVLGRMMGVWRAFLFVFYHVITSPLLWQSFFVRKIYGRRLTERMKGLSGYQCEDLVSVILPVNNGRSKGVERLVASLKNQAHKNVEFIAVDSGSTDDTVSYLRGEGWTVVEIQPQDFTHAYSRNTGASHAKGQYLLFVVDDVVFTDKDWLRGALFLMNAFSADALSSRQTIDGKADVYARVLDYFLSSAQSDEPGVNVSRNNWLSTFLRRFLPLRSQFRSVSIDDTNHLVRRSVFEKLKFSAPTVEDLDFSLRLTRSGGRAVYTNLLSVVHYHQYSQDSLAKYSRRVYIDTKVIAKWQPYVMKISSREAFLVAAFHALALALRAIHIATLHGVSSVRGVTGSGKRRAGEGAPNDKFADRLKPSWKAEDVLRFMWAWEGTKLKSIWLDQSDHCSEARVIFETIIGNPPPSNLFYDKGLIAYFLNRFKEDLVAACDSISVNQEGEISIEEFRTICLFLWTNRVMSHVARDNIFEARSVSYAFDALAIGDWS